MSDLPIPTTGRIVLYRGKDGAVRPAIVVAAHGPLCVTLNAFPMCGGDPEAGVHTSVTNAQPDQEPGCFPSWHWMPYQIQTAGTRHQDAPAKVDSPTVPQSGPRITKEQIDRLLAESTWSDLKIGAKTTVVCLTMPNGFEVIESSGCVDPTNYDHGLGVEICQRRIVDQVWKLEGYALAHDLAKAHKA